MTWLGEDGRIYTFGRKSGVPRAADMCPGMSNAICPECGLGFKCRDIDCPNDKPNPMPRYPWDRPAPPEAD